MPSVAQRARKTGAAPTKAPGENKQERIYSLLRKRILDGTYAPGQRLVIDTIARDAGVSHIPVREAIRRLEAEGFVQYQLNTGAQVTQVDELSWAEVMSTLAVLEGYMTALAAPRLTKADIRQLKKVNAAMRKGFRDLDPVKIAAHNREFHMMICERASNDYSLRLVRQSWERLDAMRKSIFIHILPRARESVEEHAQLIKLIESGAPADEIDSFAREHKLHTVRAYEERLAATSVAS